MRLRAAVLALGVVLTVLSAPATAAPQATTAGSMSWSILSSTSSYHLNHPNGKPSIVVADGASPAGTLTSVRQIPESWTWPFRRGTYDPATGNLTIQYGGSVLYQDTSGAEVSGPGPSGGASPFTYLKLANPTVTLDFTTRPVTRTLSMEVTGSRGARPSRIAYSSRLGPTAGLTPAAPADRQVAYDRLGVLISDEYSQAHGGGFLAPGSIADPVSFQVTTAAAVVRTTTPPAAAPDAVTTGPKTSGPSTAGRTTPDAPGDTTGTPTSSGAAAPPPSASADESPTPPDPRAETSQGDAVLLGVQRRDDSGPGAGFVLFGAACLVALVTALVASPLLRTRRSRGPAAP